MKDFGSTEQRSRSPIKGLRAKLRTALRVHNITVKFRTDILRDGTIVVMSNDDIVLPFDTFDGHPVQIYRQK